MDSMTININGKKYTFQVNILTDNCYEIKSKDNTFKIYVEDTSCGIVLKENDKNYDIALNRINPSFYELFINGLNQKVSLEQEQVSLNGSENLDGKVKVEKIISSPITGTISKVFCKKGSKVKTQEQLVSIIAMKMENKILASSDSKIKNIFVKEGDKVFEGEKLLEFE